jgi:hypothetical protein
VPSGGSGGKVDAGNFQQPLSNKKILIAGCSVVEADAEESNRPFSFKVTQIASNTVLLLACPDRFLHAFIVNFIFINF